MDEDFSGPTGIKVRSLNGHRIVVLQLMGRSGVVLGPEKGPGVDLARGVGQFDERVVEWVVFGKTPNIVVTDMALEE